MLTLFSLKKIWRDSGNFLSMQRSGGFSPHYSSYLTSRVCDLTNSWVLLFLKILVRIAMLS